MKKNAIILWGLVILSFIIGAFAFKLMPEVMVTHWDTRGIPNGYSARTIGVWLFPILNLFLAGLFIIIPKIDPHKENIAKFRKYYDFFVAVMMFFMVYIYSLTLLWNSGRIFDFNVAIIPSLALIFYYMGILISKAKQNWSIGIRTPWTLSSETVWNKTHKLGAKIFKATSMAMFFTVFPAFRNLGFTIMISFLLGGSVYLVIYSYLEYKKELRG